MDQSSVAPCPFSCLFPNWGNKSLDYPKTEIIYPIGSGAAQVGYTTNNFQKNRRNAAGTAG
jgi:hypothetical protein